MQGSRTAGRAGRLARLVVLALAALGASLAVAACGSGGSDQDKIRKVAENLANSAPAVCSQMSDTFLKRQFKDKANCEKQARGSNERNAFKVKTIKITGSKATAAVDARGGRKGVLAFVKQGGDWKLDDIKQTASAPGAAG